MLKPIGALAGLALLIAGCEAPQQRLDAGKDVHAFLVAAREGDRATFDRHVDRAALKAQLRAELDGGLAAGAGLPSSVTGVVLDSLVDGFGPESFQLATQGVGALANRTPTAPEIAAVLRPLEGGRVCLPRSPGGADCAATFADQDGTWRLVAVDVSGLRVGAPPQLSERFPSKTEH